MLIWLCLPWIPDYDVHKPPWITYGFADDFKIVTIREDESKKLLKVAFGKAFDLVHNLV